MHPNIHLTPYSLIKCLPMLKLSHKQMGILRRILYYNAERIEETYSSPRYAFGAAAEVQEQHSF